MLGRSEPQPVHFPHASPAPPRQETERVGGACCCRGQRLGLRGPDGLQVSQQAPRTEEVGKGGHRACASRCDPGGKALGVRHFGCLCRSVQLPREPPTETRWGEEAAAVLSEKGKKDYEGRGCRGWATRWHLRPGGGGGSGNQGWSSQDDGGGGGRTNRLTEPGGGGSSGRAGTMPAVSLPPRRTRSSSGSW